MPAKLMNVSVEQYLKEEELSDIRHEFVDGQVFAMTGASEAQTSSAETCTPCCMLNCEEAHVELL